MKFPKGTPKKLYRVYDVHTNETFEYFEAHDISEASYLVGKWYGEDNTDVDVEEAHAVKDYTMIEKLMDIAQERLEDSLPENQFADDWQWGETCFQFVITTIIHARTHKCTTSDPFRFCYDPDEATWGTPEEQLNDWMDRYDF